MAASLRDGLMTSLRSSKSACRIIMRYGSWPLKITRPSPDFEMPVRNVEVSAALVAHWRRPSPLQHLRGRVVRWKKTLKSKLRKGHIDRRAEHRHGADEAQRADVGDELERDEYSRGFVAGRRHARFQHVRGRKFRELRK